MAATLITETESIEVSSVSMLVYGPPGAWKTSLAQTANNPITLDFDVGAHRAFNRKAVMRFGKWADVADATPEIAKRQTVVVDTIGRLLDLLSADIVANNAKHGSAVGGLSLQGYGALKARFAAWVNHMRLAGKDLVFLCHEKEEKDGDDRIMRPDIQGGSYTEVMKFTDLVGYLNVNRQGQRLLDFNPSDRHLGKNAVGWPAMNVPNLADNPTFLAGLFAQAKDKIGKTSQASAAIAVAVQDVEAFLAADPTLDELNGKLADLAKLPDVAKRQVWELIQDHAAKLDLHFDKQAKKFTQKETVAA